MDNQIASTNENKSDAIFGVFIYIVVFYILIFYLPEPVAAIKRAAEAYPGLTYIYYGIPICLSIIYIVNLNYNGNTILSKYRIHVTVISLIFIISILAFSMNGSLLGLNKQEFMINYITSVVLSLVISHAASKVHIPHFPF
jgi:hypothetical protein